MDRTYFGGCELRAHLAEESMFAKDKSTGFLLVSQGRWGEFKPDIQTNAFLYRCDKSLKSLAVLLLIQIYFNLVDCGRLKAKTLSRAMLLQRQI